MLIESHIFKKMNKLLWFKAEVEEDIKEIVKIMRLPRNGQRLDNVRPVFYAQDFHFYPRKTEQS